MTSGPVIGVFSTNSSMRSHDTIKAKAFVGILIVLSLIALMFSPQASGQGVTISPTIVSVTEGGATEMYSILLDTMPNENVTIIITPDSQVTVFPTMLMFSPSNWSIEQNVTVLAEDDAVAEGFHIGTINHTAYSLDPNYNGTPIADVTVNITDNDPGVTISPITMSLTEGGAMGNYNVFLDTQPTDNVTITFNLDGQVTVFPTMLMFSPSNWSIEQNVWVFAEDDAVAEGVHIGTINHTAYSLDPNYNGTPITDVTVNIIDNDLAGITVSPTSLNVTENGAMGLYSIVLDTMPIENVTIYLITDGQVTAFPTQLMFSTSNWSIEQYITVTAMDDDVAEGDHTGLITHISSSLDDNYEFITVFANANITDNDLAGITISPITVNVTEGGATDNYTVVLASQPISNVTVIISPIYQVTVSPSVLVFSPLNWSITRTITVMAVDDLVVEGAHSGLITHTAFSGDLNYDNATITHVTAIITDNDDNTPPTTSVYLSGATGENGWYISSVSVTFSAMDDFSGVASTSYQIDDEPWQTYVGPIIVAEDGLNTIQYFSIDNAGNADSIKSRSINIDATPPSISIISPSTGATLFRHDLEITWTANDNTSGIDRFEVTLDEGTPMILGATETDHTFRGVAEGSHTIKVTAFDRAGNSETTTFGVIVRKDKLVANLVGGFGIGLGVVLLGVAFKRFWVSSLEPRFLKVKWIKPFDIVDYRKIPRKLGVIIATEEARRALHEARASMIAGIRPSEQSGSSAESQKEDSEDG